MTEEPEEEVILSPCPGPQTHFLSAGHIYEVFFGGARCGGKSYCMLLDWLRHATEYGKAANGLIVRREVTQLQDLIRESKNIYSQLGWIWKEHSKTWVTDKGARLKFDHLENDDEAERFLGWSLTWFGVEEITLFPTPEPLFKIAACLRSPVPGLKVNLRATGNPGGIGHKWVKKRYVDPQPEGYKLIEDEFGNQRMFIPAKASDNTHISPEYLNRVKQAAPNANILKGWLDGSWDFVEGSFFDEWNEGVHILKDFVIPHHWPRFCGFDPGSNDPAAVLWAAIVSDDLVFESESVGGQVIQPGHKYEVGSLPIGAMVIYKELYFAKEDTDVGLRLPIESMAEDIKEAERYQIIGGTRRNLYTNITGGTRYKEPANTDGTPKISKRVAGLDLFFNKNGPSLAERMAYEPNRLNFSKAETARVSSYNKLGGHNMFRWRLQGNDGVPMLYFFESCRNCRRTIPTLQVDEKNPEEMAFCRGQDCYDASRYLTMCRPFIPHQYDDRKLRPMNIVGDNQTIRIDPPSAGWLADLEYETAWDRRLSMVGKSRRIM